MNISTTIALVAVAIACGTGCPPPPTPPPGPAADAAPDPPTPPDDPDAAAATTCSAWCKHALELRCDAALPTRKGAGCVEVCTNVQSGPAKYNLRCRASAKTCALADACER